MRSAVVASWDRGAIVHLTDGSEKRICWLSLNFRVCMLLKGAVTLNPCALKLDIARSQCYAGF